MRARKQETRRPSHLNQEGFWKIRRVTSFESPMNQQGRRAVATGDRSARSSRARGCLKSRPTPAVGVEREAAVAGQ